MVERRNSEMLDTIDINGESTIILFAADVGENEQLIPEKRLKTGV
jgi:hypothetical protein